ncbi:MAG: alpha/beta hydrolase [Steroidobacteraceae bacterium]|nr:alpha/beta hydrolase [Steroidobacteraceae bacterium]
MNEGLAAEHITPYDRLALDEATMVALLASKTRNEGLVDYFGAALHAELVKLARATTGPRRRRAPGTRVYVLPGIMGSQLGFLRRSPKPADILWLDPIDIAFGRLTDLALHDESRIVALGAMNYTYLKLTLSLRKAGYDAVLLDYDWRRDIASLGTALAERISADGREEIAIVGHSMGGLVARAALTHAAGKQVSQVILLGTPNAGSLAAVQALRGTYSVVRKIAMLDLRHSAEFLAQHVFSTFPGLHELLPAGRGASDFDLFDSTVWPAAGPAANAALLRNAAGLDARLAPADPRFHLVIGCNRTTATGVALREGEFEYEYSLQGDGTVPIELARLAGARHSYVECSHSDLPLDDRVIAATADLLATGATQRRRCGEPHARARCRAARAVPGQDRLAAHDARTAATVSRHAERSAAWAHGAAAAARGRETPRRTYRHRRRRQCANGGGSGCRTARGTRARCGRRRRQARRRRDRGLAATSGGQRRRRQRDADPARSAARRSRGAPRP